MDTNENHVTVVSGGGSGMGRDTALRLADAGETVLVVGRRDSALRETAKLATSPDRIEVVAADLTTAAGAASVVTAVAGRPVHGIVAAAGGQGAFYHSGSDTVLSDVEQRWTAALRLNFYSSLLLVEGLLPLLADRRGRVVLIGSTAALDGDGGPYVAAKAALHGYGLDLARRLGPRGVTVNVVAPGFVGDTGFFEAAGFGSSEPLRDQLAAHTLVGRVGTPSDVSECVRWLLSESAGWVTGQVISPNGGTVLVH
jgi:3-oxoacyl-[acyl-carrier protein] reductase